MANDTVVRVGADASGYMAELAKAKTSAQAFQVSQDQMAARVEAAQAAITEATANSSNASSRAINSFIQSLAKQADQAGQTRSAILQMQAAQLGVADSAAPFIAQIKAAEDAMDGVGHSAAGAQRELVVLAHELSQGNYSRFGGSLMVLAERLDLTKYLTPTTIGLAALAAGVVGVVTALNSIQKQVDQFNDSLKLTNDWAGVTRDTAAQLAQTVATQMGTSFGTAQANIDATVASGRVLGQDLQTVTEIAMDMAKQTGESFDQALEKVTAQSDNVQQAAQKWEQSHHDMSQATLDHIKTVDEAGDHVTALRILYEQELQTMQSGTTTHVSAMSAAWNSFLDGISRMGRFMTGNATNTDQLAQLKANLNDTGPDGANAFGVNTAAIQSQIAALEQQAKAAADAKVQADAVSSAQASLAQIQQKVNDELEKGATNAEKRAKAEKDANDQYAARIALAKQAGQYTPQIDSQYAAQRDKLIADADNQYKDPRAAKPKQYHDDAATTMLQQLRDQDASVKSQLDSTNQLTDAQQQLAKFNQQISDWQGKQLTSTQQSLVDHQDEIRNALQLLDIDQKRLQANKDKQDLQNAADRAAQSAVNYQSNQQQQYSRQLDAFGMGTEAQKQAESVKSIYAEYNRQQDQITKTASKSGLLGSDDYQKDIADNRAALQQSLQLYADYYTQLKAKQADWRNGVTTAMQDYIDQSSNAAAQAQQAFTDGVKGMEDAIVSLATTGKMNFTNLANSIIADIVRMELRAAESSLFSQIIGMFTPFSGLGTLATTDTAASLSSGVTASSYSSGLMGLTSLLPGRAGGGNVSGGQAYYVGEQGPELFVPGTNGKIVPNHASAIGGAGGGDVQVQVVNNSSAQVGQPKVSSDQSGKKFIRMIIDQAKSEIAGDMASGQGDASKALTQRYGLTPRFR